MHSFLYCSWSVMMTFTVLFLIIPNSALGHLGSALKTGSGEGRPPILSHVRVSREPQPHQRILLKNDGASDPFFPGSKIKSPSYQHKILQFHSNGQTSSGGYDEYLPLKLITNHYPSTKSMPIYPVASKFGKVDNSRLIGSTSTGNWNTSENDDDENDDSWERYSSSRWEPNLLPKSEQPTYTPFIGARALTNIPQFFQHLRDNIHSIYEKQRESAANKEGHEGTLAASLLSSADEKGEEDVDKFSETQDIKIATPTRRGYSSNSQPTIVQDDDVADEDITNRDARASGVYTLGSQISSGKSNDAEVDGKVKELLYFLGHRRQEYPKANNYNPAWLFTNLGLGKRSRSSIGGSGDSFINQ